ncbi:MAG: hypothetical protein V4563_01120 [Pseudomonadota bacterium]
MKNRLENLKAARMALFTLVIASVLGFLLLRFALQAQEGAQQRLGHLQIALNEARHKLSQTGNEKDLVQQYLEAYHTLQQRGFIGPDQRLAWRDALVDGGRHLAIREMKFSIDPQQPYSGVVPVDVGKMALHEANINFSARLFDANDLAQLIDMLAGQPNGIFGVRDCELKRDSLQFDNPREAQLQTQCHFVWYTLNPAGDSGNVP